MRTDTKNYYEIPQEMKEGLKTCGYQLITPQDKAVFNPYYDKMNDHWSSGTCFSTMIAWKDVFPIFYKIEHELILGVTYLRPEAKLIAIPFIGFYTEESVQQALGILKKDFELLQTPLAIMDVVPWMYEYYIKGGIRFAVEDNRDYMDYTFTREDFLAGMDTQDDRYRYRYFKRKFAYETEEIRPEHRDEIREFMINKWCSDKQCEECHDGCMLHIVDNVIALSDQVDINGIIVRIDGETAGFCMVTCRNGLGVYLLKHAINKFKGINEYILRECFEKYMQSAVTINYTEDMGEESLRYYKMHMAPNYQLLSKMTLTEQR